VKEIFKTETFIKWMKKLKDKTGKFIIAFEGRGGMNGKNQ